MKKGKLAPVLSSIVWGSGQIFINKQKKKGLIFFFFQFVLLFTELFTGWWVEDLFGRVTSFTIREHGGFFTRGIWGLITLGEIPGPKNDHSIMLMISGLIVVIVLLIFLGLYIWNILDARKIGQHQDNNTYEAEDYFKKGFESIFEYLVLLPGMIVILLISIMPIIFTFLVAFTNYNRLNLPPGQLVNWVGLDSFSNIMKISTWSNTFFGLLVWTITWAILSTLSVFVGGLVQALIVNNERIKAKKMWRTILILPWAIPGMISLLVFRNTFKLLPFVCSINFCRFIKRLIKSC